MKAIALSMILLSALALGACESRGGSALLGGAAGAAVGAGGLEYNIYRQKQRVEQDRKDGRIGQEEYRIRMDQIARDSVVQ